MRTHVFKQVGIADMPRMGKCSLETSTKVQACVNSQFLKGGLTEMLTLRT